MQETIKSGKDKLLYEDNFCYIIENGNTHLKENNHLKFAKKRISLVIKEHKSKLNKKERYLADSILITFMTKKFGLKQGKDYFIKCTMGTYSKHYHTHAYIFPFSDKGKII